MTRKEFQNLKIGDICVIKRGHDQGKKGMVVYIESEIDDCESLLIKAIDCEYSVSVTHTNRYLRLTNYRELDILKIEGA